MADGFPEGWTLKTRLGKYDLNASAAGLFIRADYLDPAFITWDDLMQVYRVAERERLGINTQKPAVSAEVPPPDGASDAPKGETVPAPKELRRRASPGARHALPGSVARGRKDG